MSKDNVCPECGGTGKIKIMICKTCGKECFAKVGNLGSSISSGSQQIAISGCCGSEIIDIVQPESNSDEIIINFSDEDKTIKAVYDNLLDEGDKAIFYSGYSTGVKSQQSIIDEAIKALTQIDMLGKEPSPVGYILDEDFKKALNITRNFLDKIEKDKSECN